jgi:hypothetical protein
LIDESRNRSRYAVEMLHHLRGEHAPIEASGMLVIYPTASAWIPSRARGLHHLEVQVDTL